MLRFETARADQKLVYILTLGVVESYRNLGIGMLFSFVWLLYLVLMDVLDSKMPHVDFQLLN